MKWIYWVLLLCGASSMTNAATLTVCQNACDYSLIQVAVNNASAGDTVRVSVTSPHTEADVIIDRNLIIEGIGETDTIVQAHANQDTAVARVFTVLAGAQVTFRRLTIRHGYSQANGGGLLVLSEPGNDAEVILDRVTFRNNRADSGGAIANAGKLTLTDATVRSNSAFHNGGGVHNTGDLSATRVDIESNHADLRGGGIYNAGEMDIKFSDIVSNTADIGGGIFNGGELDATSVDVKLNTASIGAGAYNTGTLTAERLLVSENKLIAGFADDFGGAGIYTEGTLMLTNSELSDNEAHILPNFGRGGGLMVEGGSVTMEAVGIVNNSADNTGGMYIDEGTVTMTRSHIIGNTATQFTGGMVIYAGLGYLTNVTIADNAAGTSAGGVHACGGELTLANVTVAGNIANSDFDSVGDGGGIWYCSGVTETVRLRSSIVAGNIAHGGDYPDCENQFFSSSFSLIGNTGAVTNRCGVARFSSGMIVNESAELGLLEENRIYPLLASSPAIDAGACVAAIGDPPTTDQRGAVMPVDGDADAEADCDMGAYEYNSLPPSQLPLIFANGFE